MDSSADPLVEVEVARAWPTWVGPAQFTERVGVKLASGGVRVRMKGEAGVLSGTLATERREELTADLQASIPLTSTVLLKPRYLWCHLPPVTPLLAPIVSVPPMSSWRRRADGAVEVKGEVDSGRGGVMSWGRGGGKESWEAEQRVGKVWKVGCKAGRKKGVRWSSLQAKFDNKATAWSLSAR